MGKNSLSLGHSQQLSMTSSLRQAIELLQFNTNDIKNFLQLHLDKNPFLEVEEIETEEETISYSGEDFEHSKTSNEFYDLDFLANIQEKQSLHQYLYAQALLCHFNDRELIIAEKIIAALDENGYLMMTAEAICEEITKDFIDDAIELQEIEKIIRIIRSFEPAGIAASTLEECLLLQIEAASVAEAIKIKASTLIAEHFNLFLSSEHKKIAKKMQLSIAEYQLLIKFMRTLQLRPGNIFTDERHVNKEPELYVKKNKNQWQVFLFDSVLTQIKLNQGYATLMQANKKNSSYSSLKKEFDEAKFLLSGLKRRNQTLLSVGQYLVQKQKEFFDNGHSFMKSMNIAEVACALQVHESTISRITSGKYISTPHGMYELKYFFPSHVTTQDGELCSATAIKSYIQEIINNESPDHILSDEELAVALRAKGINIARRTVAKYRESLQILASYQRMRHHPLRV